MLKQLRRLERSRKLIILGFAILMAVSLVFFYAPSRSATSIDPSRNLAVVAKVGSAKITVADIAQLQESYRQMFGGRISLAQLGGNKRLLDSLINKEVIAQEAERLGLAASDAEVRAKITKQFADASGVVNIERYKESVTARYGSIEKFEQDVRDEIAQEKLKAFLSAGVNVSDEEVKTEFIRSNTSFDVSYVVVSAAKVAEKIQPSDDELKNYYEAHKTDYRYNEPQRKVRYLFINTEKASSKLAISDKELKDEYDGLQPQFKEAGVKVQQIVLKVARPDLDAQVQQKANEVLAKLRGSTGQVTEQAFAEAARGNSEEPTSAGNNGFLNRIIKKNPNKPDQLYERAVDMGVGEVSEAFKFGNNYYILRRGDSVPKTFEEAKAELLVSLRNRRGFSVAFKLAGEAQKRLKEVKDVQKVAQEFATQANMTAAEMVRETGYIKPGDDVPEIGSNQQFEAAVAPLNNAGDVGEATGIKNGFAIPLLLDKKEPRIPEFDEVKTKVADAVKREKATQQLEQQAKDFAASVGGADGLKAAGEKAGFESGNEDAFKLGARLGDAGASSALDDVIFAMKAGELQKTPVKVGENYVIVGVTKRTDADMANFEKEKDSLKNSLASERQNQLFEDYITGLTRRMKDSGAIKVYDDVLNTIEEEEPAALPGGLNFPG